MSIGSLKKDSRTEREPRWRTQKLENPIEAMTGAIQPEKDFFGLRLCRRKRPKEQMLSHLPENLIELRVPRVVRGDWGQFGPLPVFLRVSFTGWDQVIRPKIQNTPRHCHGPTSGISEGVGSKNDK
jgi:hypothetical protein